MSTQTNGSSKILDVIRDVGIVLAVVVGVVNLLIVVWRGGAMYNMVITNDARLGVIEKQGSKTLDTHMKLNEQWEAAASRRIESLESSFGSLRISLDAIALKLAVIDERLQWFLDRAQGKEPKPLSGGRP